MKIRVMKLHLQRYQSLQKQHRLNRMKTRWLLSGIKGCQSGFPMRFPTACCQGFSGRCPMLEDAAGIRRVVLACGTVDLRKGIDGLAMIIDNKYKQNPFEKGTLFLFCGQRSDRQAHYTTKQAVNPVKSRDSGCPQSFWILDFKPGHESVERLPCNGFYFWAVP